MSTAHPPTVAMLPFVGLRVVDHGRAGPLSFDGEWDPVVGGQAVFLSVCAYSENLVCDVQ